MTSYKQHQAQAHRQHMYSAIAYLAMSLAFISAVALCIGGFALSGDMANHAPAKALHIDYVVAMYGLVTLLVTLPACLTFAYLSQD